MIVLSVCELQNVVPKEYVSNVDYPIKATKWIKENLDYKNMKIWNHFNFGSYLELNGIKVFLDSRSGMYTTQENKDCTVLEDWLAVTNGKKYYQEVFDEYGINYVLVYNDEPLNIYISNDDNYEAVYEDVAFSVYEKK